MSASSLPLAPKYLARRRNFIALYGATLLISLHWAIVLYINSSYLNQFISDTAIGMLYAASSGITILAFLFISRVLRVLGNYKLTLVLALLEFCAIGGMAFAGSPDLALPLFVLHQTVVPLILFNLDVYMEELIGKNEAQTGSRRGFMLAVMSGAGAVAPLIAGNLAAENGTSFTLVYAAAALCMLPFFFIIIRHFRTFSDPKYEDTKMRPIFRALWARADVRNVFVAHFFLQLFFAWMVIYVPIYLIMDAGFSWAETGLILFIGLFAYIIFEYPVGLVADRIKGERTIMLGGFAILALSTTLLAFLPAGALLLWAGGMFLTRVGAGFVEVTSESYFFKRMDGTSSGAISAFRITRPLSYLLGPLLGSWMLLYFERVDLFVILGGLMYVGGLFALRLRDTK